MRSSECGGRKVEADDERLQRSNALPTPNDLQEVTSSDDSRRGNQRCPGCSGSGGRSCGRQRMKIGNRA